jgi:23S rRNA pseudouridine2605 synthase
VKKETDEIMRLNKYIAQAGIASRRKADELILNGNVKVNGAVPEDPWCDVQDGDVVEVNGITIKSSAAKVYIMLNKPKGYITSVSDEKSRPVVMELVTDIEERLFPIGRLDYNTSGMLLMTNDGDLANKLMHPKHKVIKTYRARVSGVVSKERLAHLRKGVDIGGFITSKAQVDVIKQGERSAIVEIKIHEGRNRQVRKMFAAVGNKVLDLERIAVGDLYLGHLREGHYRKLSKSEIESLKKM